MPVSAYMALSILRCVAFFLSLFSSSLCQVLPETVALFGFLIRLSVFTDAWHCLSFTGILFAMGHAMSGCYIRFANHTRSFRHCSWTSVLLLDSVASACHWEKHIEDTTVGVSFCLFCGAARYSCFYICIYIPLSLFLSLHAGMSMHILSHRCPLKWLNPPQ